MASDKLMNHTQGETIIDKLTSIADSLDNISAISPAKLGLGMGVCDTAASTAAKTVAIANYAITEGAPVSVQFLYANTADNATLNINNTGAKPILYKDNPLGNNVISAGDTCTFIYTTNSYRIINIDTLTGAGTGTVTQVGAENGLITDQSDNADIHHDGKIGLNLKSTTAFSSEVSAHNTSTDNMYPVALDSEGHPVAAVPTISASGTNHKGGLVPDTPSTAGTTKYLREDATWVEPTGDNLKLTGYEKESQAAAVAATDTINEGIGKLEYKVDANSADIQSILDGTTIDSFSDVETALSGKQATLSTAQLAAVNSGIDSTKVGQIATNQSDISSLQDAVDTKLDKTANAASAAKLNNGTTDYAIGSATKGVYFNNGVPTAMTYSVNSNVPENAVFTDTKYSSGTGITVNASNAINHSNSVSEKTTASALKVAYDAQGHITGSSALTASDVGAIPTTAKGTASGVAELDANGKVPSSQLPSYVDDVLEYSAKSSFPATGESGKIYVDTSTNKTYRWSGTTYVEISESLALGETENTAYYGDKGKTAYDHSQVTSGNPHNVTKTDVGLGSVGNFKAVSTVASQGLSDTEKSNARTNIGAGTYSKPSGGIPKTDLASAVQTSLGLADTALQSFTETDPTVPSWAKQSSKPSYTASEVGLGNVGNFLAVSTNANQGLSDTQKSNARANIGAGTSNLAIGTAATQAAAGNHTHGNITNAGALQSTDVSIANGDKLVVTDASDSNKVARTSAAFDGSTATKCLTQKGTFETFGTSNLILGTTAGTAAEGNHTHTKAQITDFPTSMKPTSHTHGNIQNAGTLQTNDITIASGDKIVVTDSSDSSKIARASISFDGSTATQALTKKGTWETFNNYSHPTTSGNKHIPSGGSSGQILRWSADGTATWGADNNTWIAMVGATASANGSTGYVNATPPKDGYNTKYLRADGSWAIPPGSVTGVKGDSESSYRTGKVNITPANIGAVPTSRTVNSKALSGNITLSASDVGAATSDHVHNLSIDSSTASSASINLAANSIYTLTAGGKTYTFKTPVDNNTTYSNKSEASGGTEVSLVTTGDKYVWNRKYSKPSGGIPKSDLASAVQTSLGLADSALQSHQTIKQDGVTGATINRFGTCSIAAGTAAKTVSITTGTFTLEAGARVTVKFSNANTAGTPTLNVNSTGAKNIFHKGAQITTGTNKGLLAGTVDFIYDGTQWHLIGNYIDTNTTYSAATTSAAGLMSAADKTKLNGIATGAQVNSITGVKGNAESSYRTGNVNLTPANIGAAPSSLTVMGAGLDEYNNIWLDLESLPVVVNQSTYPLENFLDTTKVSIGNGNVGTVAASQSYACCINHIVSVHVCVTVSSKIAVGQELTLANLTSYFAPYGDSYNFYPLTLAFYSGTPIAGVQCYMRGDKPYIYVKPLQAEIPANTVLYINGTYITEGGGLYPPFPT